MTDIELEMLTVSAEDKTKELLMLISSRLSGRADCRGENYTVTINHNGISMVPLVFVYPNRYKRHESDRVDIISFIRDYKMPNTLLTDFAFGTYHYQSSIDKKRRKWVKVQ